MNLYFPRRIPAARPAFVDSALISSRRWVRGEKLLPRAAFCFLSLILLVVAVGCSGNAEEKTDAELGLNAQQSNGRAIYRQYCAACHPAYSSSGDKGPGLKRLFKKNFLPSGLPANDRFVSYSIRAGRGMMPPMSDALSESQLADLMAYLHTL